MSKKKIVALIILPIFVFLFTLFLGRYAISMQTVIQIIITKIFPSIKFAPNWPTMTETVIFQIRIPRALLAALVGAALSVSGAAFQGMFRNPLVSPDILGVSSAASFGAALAILLSGNRGMIQAFALGFGIIGMIVTYSISRIYKTTPVIMLVLSGVVTSAFFSALVSLTKYLADPYEKLPAITFWLMGSLNSASIKNVITALPGIICGMVGLLLVRWRINILAMGDEEARSLGIKTESLKAFIILCATIMTASAVSVSGMIGWVGLVIPHIGRMLVGPDHRVLIPACISIGATYLLIIDVLARASVSIEIPLGILTALIGAPFFAYLIRKTKGGWQ